MPGVVAGFQRRRTSMRMLFSFFFVLALTSAANAQDSPYRKELKRADLTGTNMEVIVSVSEIKPGESSMLHFHHGEDRSCCCMTKTCLSRPASSVSTSLAGFFGNPV
jgi:hypothetical protein